MIDRGPRLMLILLLVGIDMLNLWQANRMRYYVDRPPLETFDILFQRNGLPCGAKGT